MINVILATALLTQAPYLWHPRDPIAQPDQSSAQAAHQAAPSHEQDPIETTPAYDLLDDSERCQILHDSQACERANHE
jgi:hypothetical protein